MTTTKSKDWGRAHPATKAKYRVGGRSEAEARRLYEAGEPPPPARQSKTERKQALATKPTAAVEVDQLWANRINEADQQMQTTMTTMVERIVALGKTLLDAKQELGHGNFTAMIDNKTRLGIRAAEQYMQIAEHEVLSNPNHGSHLPPYVGTLRVLAGWKPAAVEDAIAKGDVTPDIDRAKATELSKEYTPKAITARPAAQAAPPAEPAAPSIKPQRRGQGVSVAQEQDHPDPGQNNGFTPMPDGSGQVKLRTPEWRHELGAGVVVYEDQDDDITDLAMQLTVLIERVRDLPMSKARPLLQPLKPGLIELLKLLVGYDTDRADPAE